MVQLVRGLLTQQPNRDDEQGELAVTPESIGVICFHKAQVQWTVAVLFLPFTVQVLLWTGVGRAWDFVSI